MNLLFLDFLVASILAEAEDAILAGSFASKTFAFILFNSSVF